MVKTNELLTSVTISETSRIFSRRNDRQMYVYVELNNNEIIQVSGINMPSSIYISFNRPQVMSTLLLKRSKLEIKLYP